MAETFETTTVTLPATQPVFAVCFVMHQQTPTGLARNGDFVACCSYFPPTGTHVFRNGVAFKVTTTYIDGKPAEQVIFEKTIGDEGVALPLVRLLFVP